ncbi:MAG: hypothetical protein E7K64_08015 [Clostridia bacterium]|nr:hypothetical protein [Peptococcus niger]MDU7244807.1 hypothetical protein [Clostridiales bacterium]MDU7505954.1 hypothetical protein [Clostridia bacterium]
MTKRKAVYNRAADQKWAAENKEHKKYLRYRSVARVFLRELATVDDLEEMDAIIKSREQSGSR